MIFFSSLLFLSLTLCSSAFGSTLFPSGEMRNLQRRRRRAYFSPRKSTDSASFRAFFPLFFLSFAASPRPRAALTESSLKPITLVHPCCSGFIEGINLKRERKSWDNIATSFRKRTKQRGKGLCLVVAAIRNSVGVKMVKTLEILKMPGVAASPSLCRVSIRATTAR